MYWLTLWGGVVGEGDSRYEMVFVITPNSLGGGEVVGSLVISFCIL